MSILNIQFFIVTYLRMQIMYSQIFISIFYTLHVLCTKLSRHSHSTCSGKVTKCVIKILARKYQNLSWFLFILFKNWWITLTNFVFLFTSYWVQLIGSVEVMMACEKTINWSKKNNFKHPMCCFRLSEYKIRKKFYFPKKLPGLQAFSIWLVFFSL